jgi:hypothetical protein
MAGMSKELWATLEPLLDAALEMGAEERAQLLARLRNDARAPDLVTRAVAPLTYGFGARHRLTMEASALLDSLRRN